jgi:Flp pilus assembly protein TadG
MEVTMSLSWTKKRHSAKKRRGTAAVEFAVVAPVLFLLMLGMIEIGRGVMVAQSLTSAARCACRKAIVDGSTSTTVTDAVATALAGTGISVYNVVVSPANPSSAATGATVTVTINTTYRNVSWVPLPRYLASATIARSCMLPHE